MEEENKYKYTDAYFKILDLIQSNPEENVFVICGGQGASKTVSIIELVIQSLLSSTKEATVLSSELSKMKRTVVRDYKKICKDWGVIQREEEFNRSESKHEYPNNSYLDFIGADVSDIGKGFRRDLLYINEADKLTIDQAIQFISRADLTIIDYNPDAKFWGDDFINENNFLRLTFEDNEYLSKSEVNSILDYKYRGFVDPNREDLFHEENIKSKYWANKWKVYGMGFVGTLSGAVFEDWEVKELPQDARLICTGVDFGYATSKFAAVDIYKWNDHYFLDELVYETKLTNPEAAQKMVEGGYKNSTAYCDYAEPKSIRELSDNGIHAVPCESKNDIKAFAIKRLSEKTFYITPRSKNVKMEVENLIYDEKTNKVKKSEIDHATDAIFYAVGSEGKYDGRY